MRKISQKAVVEAFEQAVGVARERNTARVLGTCYSPMMLRSLACASACLSLLHCTVSCVQFILGEYRAVYHCIIGAHGALPIDLYTVHSILEVTFWTDGRIGTSASCVLG